MDARSLFASGSRLLAATAMSLSLIVPMPAFAADANGGDDVGTTAQLAVDGDFVNFRWHMRTGSGFNINGPMTYTSRTATVVIVADAFLSGDRFKVYDGETALGVTSAPGSGQQVGPDCNKALDTPGISRGAFLRQPGAHAIRTETIATAPSSPSGQGCIRVASISKEQCREGGWERYGIFKNQGDCISFVVSGGMNPPAG